jgi:uncharacterized protein (DUF433 family)
MAVSPTFLTPREAAYVASVPHRYVQQAIDRGHVKRPFVVQRRDMRALTPAGVLLVAVDYRVGRNLSPAARARLRAHFAANPDPQRLPKVRDVSVSADEPCLIVSVGKLIQEVSQRLSALQRALRMVIEDPDVQGGAPTFKGTRLVVRPVATALARGVPRQEMTEDHGLTPEMFEAATIYAEVRPARGRPTREPRTVGTRSRVARAA